MRKYLGKIVIVEKARSEYAIKCPYCNRQFYIRSYQEEWDKNTGERKIFDFAEHSVRYCPYCSGDMKGFFCLL